MRATGKKVSHYFGWILLCLCLLLTANGAMAATKASIKLNKNKATIYTSAGKTVQLKATVTGDSKKVTWKSSAPKVATVNAKGKVTAKKAGTAKITAKANGVTATCRITVKKTSIKLNKGKATIYTSGAKTVTLKATVVGKSKKVTWTSSNTKVAVVSNSGKVKAKNTGTATITAKANGLTAKCVVTVKKQGGPDPVPASVKQTYEKGVACYKRNDVAGANRYFKTLDKNANEACVKKMSRSVKTAYLNVLKSYRLERKDDSDAYYVDAYYLTDIDKDGLPELIIKYGSCEANYASYIYTYNKGKAIKLGMVFSGHSSMYYDPRGNGVTIHYAHSGGESISTIKISSGKIIQEEWGSSSPSLGSNSYEYVQLPFHLDYHIRYGSNFNRSVDLSPLR